MQIDKAKEIKQLGLRQGAIKILINSVYGAFGNQYFYFFNIDIAQSITLQGQDMIKFANKAINFYFKEFFSQRFLFLIVNMLNYTLLLLNNQRTYPY